MRDGDVIRLDSEAGTLRVELSDAELLSRVGSGAPASDDDWVGTGGNCSTSSATRWAAPTPARRFQGCPPRHPGPATAGFRAASWRSTTTASSHHIGDLLNRAPVIPVIVIDDEAVAVPLAQALVAGGLTVLEVTLRTKCALASIKRIVAEVPDAVVGAGTILTQADVAASVEAGAQFLVSPVPPGGARRHARQRRRPLPGAGDRVGGVVLIERGLRHGKFFPPNPPAGSLTSRRSRDRCRTSGFVPPGAST